MFKRKAYNQLLEWKKFYNGATACLLEGARRVGKTTIAEEFAQNEYRSYIKIDFANVTAELLDVFRDISKLDLFFLRLQAETNITLYERESVILFDEVQLYPKARQAIKYLVKDGRFDYIETGSLISIKKNVKGIVIPSEETKINVFPMDYEEFLWATGGNPDLLRQVAATKEEIGNSTNNTLMRNFRIYMAVGGMPQAVNEYLEKNNFEYVDAVKRGIIELYMDDLRKIDDSGRLSDIYKSVPSQLALQKKRFVISAATGKAKTTKDEERIFDLIDSKMVIPCYHVTKPNVALSQTREYNNFKLYLSDIGLFTTMLFNGKEWGNPDIYKKLLSNKLDADLGYLYENAVAQMLLASGRALFYHTWRKENSTHSYEIDFLITHGHKVIPIEVKSSSVRNHKSIAAFSEKYSSEVGEQYLFSQKDSFSEGELRFRPIYLFPFIMEGLTQ
ncbi:MAG: ATP-binding protein [Lachnospiraceae bacterium]|nr:ATP-binding protein [Lachnospiraceae bacterium]